MWWWNKWSIQGVITLVWGLLQLGCGPVQAQNQAQPTSVHRCGYPALLEQIQADPQRYRQIQAMRALRSSGAHSPHVRQVPTTEGGESMIVLPVVFHVMHAPSDTVVGQGTNLSDEQIQSQLVALNHDFARKAGTRGFNQIPVGADAKVVFVLAGRDPQGQWHKGINRVPYEASMAHPMGGDLAMKDLSRWPVDRYVNIWVVGRIQLGVLGYAWLPSMLVGDPQYNRADGVVLSAQVTGSLDWVPPGQSLNLHPVYAYGRTLTHEMGHYLDLYHTWGDGDCTVDDEIEDTPNCDGPLFGCPSVAPVDCPPALPRMISNYMDYTDDDCMNVFTQGQVQRMRQSLGTLYPWRAVLMSDSNLARAAVTPVTAPYPAVLVRVNGGGAGNCAVNDTLGGNSDRLRLMDNRGLGMDSTSLALHPAVDDEAGLRVLSQTVPTDAFGFATFGALSGPRPGLNRMQATTDGATLGGSSPVLVLEWTASAEARLYPNPFEQNLYMQWPETDSVDLSWTLVDRLGRECGRGTYTGEAFWSLPVEELPAGIFVLRLDYAGGRTQETHRLVKR